MHGPGEACDTRVGLTTARLAQGPISKRCGTRVTEQQRRSELSERSRDGVELSERAVLIPASEPAQSMGNIDLMTCI